MNGLQHENAFVVQFRTHIDLESDELSGRVEHVASGRTATFASVQELPWILRRMLADAATDGKPRLVQDDLTETKTDT